MEEQPDVFRLEDVQVLLNWKEIPIGGLAKIRHPSSNAPVTVVHCKAAGGPNNADFHKLLVVGGSQIGAILEPETSHHLPAVDVSKLFDLTVKWLSPRLHTADLEEPADVFCDVDSGVLYVVGKFQAGQNSYVSVHGPNAGIVTSTRPRGTIVVLGKVSLKAKPI